MQSKKRRGGIFLGLSEVSGLYQGLAEGFQQLGINVTRVDLANHPFQYSTQREHLLVRLFHLCKLHQKSKNKISSYFWQLISVATKLLLLTKALMQNKIFIFSYGTTFFRLWDLTILKFFNKKIIFQFHGSDSRPPFIDGTLIYDYSTDAIAKMSKEKKQKLIKINRYADAIIDIPPMGLFHEKKFINWLQVGLTVSVTKASFSEKHLQTEVVNILHAPSNSLAKGTVLIEAAVARLKKQGYKINLIKIENQLHEKVKAALSQCDFVIDQLFADYPMPGLATESAWFKTPTLICGYASDLWSELLCEKTLPPTHYCHPDELESAMKLLCDDVNYRRQLGQKAFDFVSTTWSPLEVAKRYLRVIDNDVPEKWVCDPSLISYIHGCGIAEDKLKIFLKKYIEEQGQSALMLQDKPGLKKRFIEFSESQSGA